jgi:CRP-like cAMP-binding protein
MTTSHDLFAGIDPTQSRQLRNTLPLRHWEPGEAVLEHGASNEQVHLIESGIVEVWRGELDHPDALKIATLNPGDCVGEMSAFADHNVTATVIAQTKVTTRSFTPNDLPAGEGIRTRIISNLANQLVARLVRTNDHLTSKHDAERDTQKQLLASLMMVGRILFTVCLYVFLLPIAAQLKEVLPSDSLISFGFIIFLTSLTITFQRKSTLPRSAYGLDFDRWPHQIWRGVVWSIPVLLGAVALKWGWLHFNPGPGRLFEPERALSVAGEMPWGQWSLFLGVYAILSFAQEYVRAVTQGGLTFFYRTAGQPDRWKALFIANIIFAILHIHLSPVFAGLAFGGGLIWGWIFQREQSYLAAATAHLLIGCWVVFFLGIPY